MLISGGYPIEGKPPTGRQTKARISGFPDLILVISPSGYLLEFCADVVRSAQARTIGFGFTLAGWPQYVEARITPYDGDTVEATRGRVMRKLGARNVADLVRSLLQPSARGSQSGLTIGAHEPSQDDDWVGAPA